MKVFASWSGEGSKRVALLLKSWLPKVLQSVEVYVSDRDVQGGERWYQSIVSSLEQVDFGIVALTKDNKCSPWIQFEAGALSKSIETARVIPLLCNLTTLDLAGNPLSHFQAKAVDRDDMLDVVKSVNAACEKQLSADVLQETFGVWWDEFSKKYLEIEFDASAVQQLTPDERLERIETVLNEMGADIKTLARAEASLSAYDALLAYAASEAASRNLASAGTFGGLGGLGGVPAWRLNEKGTRPPSLLGRLFDPSDPKRGDIDVGNVGNKSSS